VDLLRRREQLPLPQFTLQGVLSFTLPLPPVHLLLLPSKTTAVALLIPQTLQQWQQLLLVGQST
jgi:hypothetical protein